MSHARKLSNYGLITAIAMLGAIGLDRAIAAATSGQKDASHAQVSVQDNQSLKVPNSSAHSSASLN